MESGDNVILKKFKKRVTIEQIEFAVKLSAKYGFKVSVSFMIGHAFDIIQTIEKILDFAKYLQKEYGVFAFGTINTPIPGTEQYKKADELGIEIYPNGWGDFKLIM